MATPAMPVVRFEFEQVVRRAFGLVRRNVLPFGLIVLSLIALPQLIIGGLGRPDPANVGLTLLRGLLGLSAAAASIVAHTALQRGAANDLEGRPFDVARSLALGVKLFFPIFGISFLVGMGVFLGLLLLVVPGVILALVWSVAIAARVIDTQGVFASMQRSRDLTRGHRWSIFGLYLCYGLAVAAVEALVLVFSGGFSMAGIMALSSGFGLARIAFYGLIVPISAALTAALTTAVYYELTRGFDSSGAKGIGAVFD